MPMPSRRIMLTKVFAGASFLLAGCQSTLRGDGSENSITSEDTSSIGSSPTDRDKQTISTPVESNLEKECVTSEFTGYVSTTPLPAPEKPDKLESESVIDYAVAYERYYERYLALYEIGSPTPKRENYPAHGFPEVRLEGLEKEVKAESDNRYVIHLTFSRFFENKDQGEYTVTYYISNYYTVRAEVKGSVYPGPDPLIAGKIMSC